MLEESSAEYRLRSFEIETTAMEEVFLRIANEDNEQLILDHAQSNRLIGEPPELRDENLKHLITRDNERVPLTDYHIDALFIKGSTTAKIVKHVRVMFYKRFFQFFRSPVQWVFGIVAPICLAVAIGALLSSMSSSGLFLSQHSPVLPYYSDFFPIQVACSTEAVCQDYLAQAFPEGIKISYAGATYSDLYNDIKGTTSSEDGPISSEGIAYASFTVMYNSSYALNFPGVVQSLLNAAVANGTNML